MPHIVVLGGGLIGRAIALDLASDKMFAVTVADRDPLLLDRLSAEGLAVRPLDFTDRSAINAAVADADAVVGAAPGHMGFGLLRAMIEAGKPYADISFMPEDALALDALASERGATAIVDCGVAPGLSNLLCGRADALFQNLERLLILVGGLPRRRVWPFEYRIVFSPVDVIEEYTRPARFVEHGRVVVRPALSDVELVELPRVGTLEAFNTDGLRSLTATLRAPFIKEKTLRYPGHAEKMRMLAEAGFFSSAPITIPGSSVRPIDVTSRLLFDAWRLPEGEADLTVLRVEVEGTRSGQRCRYTWDLYDERDPKTGLTSMARTTGFPCAIIARLLATGALHLPGVHPPEDLGHDEKLFAHIEEELKNRGVEIGLSITPLADPAARAQP
jgi:lysine 6-dehydrogenase